MQRFILTGMFAWLRSSASGAHVRPTQVEQCGDSEERVSGVHSTEPSLPPVAQLSPGLQRDICKSLRVFEQLLHERASHLDKDVRGVQDYFVNASAGEGIGSSFPEQELRVRRSLRQLEDFILVARIAILMREIVGEPELASTPQPRVLGALESALRELRRASQDPMIATIGSGGGQPAQDDSLRALYARHHEELGRWAGPEE